MWDIAQTTGREQPTMSTNVIAIAGMAGLTSESKSAELPVSSVAVGRLHREREGLGTARPRLALHFNAPVALIAVGVPE
jgi:hypothetical protein